MCIPHTPRATCRCRAAPIQWNKHSHRGEPCPVQGADAASSAKIVINSLDGVPYLDGGPTQLEQGLYVSLIVLLVTLVAMLSFYKPGSDSSR